MRRWYVMHSKPRKESFLREQLIFNRIEVYLPSIPVRSHANKEKPFFPGYLFIHVDLEKVPISDLRWIPGAIGILCFGSEPAYIHAGLIRSIQKHVEDVIEKGKKSDYRFNPGDRVMIIDGPFANYQAIFDNRLSGHNRVRVLLGLLQGQKIPLELSTRQIRPLTH